MKSKQVELANDVVTFRNISSGALAAALPRPRMIDVREPQEFTGDLGHVPGAELVPLGTLESAARGWARDEPIVVICRSGARSAKAAALRVKLGFRNVQNLEGGMQQYANAGLAVIRA